MDKQEMLRRLKAGNFVANNGYVLRTINILRYTYVKLTSVESVAADAGIAADEYLDSINYLSESQYIRLREIASKDEAALSDTDYHRLEAKLTAKGIRLLAGGIHDELVEV